MHSVVGQSFPHGNVLDEPVERWVPGGWENHWEDVALVPVRNKTGLTPVSLESDFPD